MKFLSEKERMIRVEEERIAQEKAKVFFIILIEKYLKKVTGVLIASLYFSTHLFSIDNLFLARASHG